MSARNACEKCVKDRNSIKCNVCLTKVQLKCNYLTYVDSQHITFSNKTWHYYNRSKDLFPFTTTNNFKLYLLLRDKTYCNNDSNESCLALKPPKYYHIYFMNLIPSDLISIIFHEI